MAKAKAAGSFIGALFNNPTFLILGALGIGLLFFQKDIRNAFASIGEGFGNITLPEIKLPDITLPDINFPEFPKIELPDFTGLFTGFQEQFNLLFQNQKSILAGQTIEQGKGTVTIPEDTIVNPDGTVTSTTPPTGTQPTTETFGGETFPLGTFAQERASLFDFLVAGGQTPVRAQIAISKGEFGDFDFLEKVRSDFIEFFGKPEPAPLNQGLDNEVGFVVPFNDPLGLGGGGSFIGGTTTFGDETNIVDTLSEVLAIFPNLTASQAADALAENVGLTPNQFAQTDPDIINISSQGFDPDQILLNASGGFSGLTPEQIANILTGGNIQNF